MRAEHASDMRKAAEAAYAKHQIGWTVESEKLLAWEVARPKRSWMYWTCITVTSGRLMITGDGPDLIVRGGPQGRNRLDWFASASMGYLTSKILAGPHSNVRLGVEWDGELAAHDIQKRIDDAVADAEKWGEPADVDDWLAVQEGFCPDSGPQAMWALAAEHIDDLGELSLGQRPAGFLYYAQAAVARLLELLAAQPEASK